MLIPNIVKLQKNLNTKARTEHKEHEDKKISLASFVSFVFSSGLCVKKK